ncbi:MAG: hypothetical protein V4667_00695 [Bacteroidota bacterium]
MKYPIFLTLILISSFVNGQNYTLVDGEYMDTISLIKTDCPKYNVYYYQVNGKYPKSSSSLLKEVQAFLQNKTYSGSGYITFRCRINCNGKLDTKTQVLQTDEKYKTTRFDKRLLNDLFDYFKTLDKWEIPTNNEEIPFSYIVFITFKLKNGKIINIIP